MISEEVQKILLKYQQEESVINEKLQQQEQEILEKARNTPDTCDKKYLSLKAALKRNKTIIKELETVKGNLRSKAIYSPSEMQWGNICKQYRSNPSLQIISWKCHLPVFV